MSAFDQLDPAARRAAFAHMADHSKAKKAVVQHGHAAVPATRLAPPKPKGMSEKRYRELHDSEPHYVEAPGVRYKVAGLASAQAVVDSFRRQGIEPTVRPVNPKKRAADVMKAAKK